MINVGRCNSQHSTQPTSLQSSLNRMRISSNSSETQINRMASKFFFLWRKLRAGLPCKILYRQVTASKQTAVVRRKTTFEMELMTAYLEDAFPKTRALYVSDRWVEENAPTFLRVWIWRRWIDDLSTVKDCDIGGADMSKTIMMDDGNGRRWRNNFLGNAKHLVINPKAMLDAEKF